MKTAHGRLAVLAAVALAGVTAFVPEAPATPAEPKSPAEPAEPTVGGNPDERAAPQSIFSGTAIGFVLAANGNEVPKSGEEMMKALAKLGEFAQLPVTFSAVDLHTGLANPRVVITQRVSTNNIPGLIRPGAKPDDPDQLVIAPAGFGPEPTQASLHTGKLTRPNLEGRLFLAANMEKKDGELRVKTFEFISWNSRRQKFDFGFIECDEVEPQIRVVDGVKCFSCHKNKGPILGLGPWSNTPHNDVVRTALATHHAVNLQALCLPGSIGQPRRLDTGFDAGIVKLPKTVHDGMKLFVPQGPSVDAAVRLGADAARDRDVYRAMVRSADGRKALVVLLTAIAAPGPLERNSQQAKVALDQTFATTYPTFAEKWLAIHKASSSVLADFNPSGSMGTLQAVSGSPAGWGFGSTLQPELRVSWGGDPKQVTEYDAKRAEGDHGLPSARQPSNPRAFVRPGVSLPGKPSAAVNAVALARLIGLTEGDRTFLADQLAVGARQLDKKTATALAKEVFAGPQFADLFTAGDIPDREDFKDRFVTGLNAALKAQGASGLSLVRKDYASGPNVAPAPGQEEKEVPVVATTACLRCHDVRGVGKPAFNPIPQLAFDPFDKDSREAWAKATPDAKKRAAVLARMVKRLGEDKDMPPEDSAEYDSFRVKNASGFDAVKEWLDAELKRAR